MYLEIKNVTKMIGKEMVLNHINLSMEKGKIYGLKGKNGSGKTMLMRAICGLIRVTSGEIVISDELLGKNQDFPSSVGALIENPGFINNYSGYQNLKVLADIQGRIGKERINEVLEQVGLNPADKKKFRKYSLGMKQKLGIAAAIMENPEIIILDEPTNALDEFSIKKLRDILNEHKNRGALILLSSHDIEEIQLLSDEIYIIENGGINDHYVTTTSN